MREPELVVVNARLFLGEVGRWAEAVAVSGERVAAVGRSDEIRALAGPRTRVVDARGGLVAPGFIDAHIHFLAGGLRLASVQLRDVRSRAAFVRRVAEFAARVPPGTWITGGDWDHSLWGGELPERGWIDAVTPEHPAWLSRVDGHMAMANGAALAAAGVDATTADVEGGSIVRDGSGAPTGVLKDNAMALVERAVPPPPRALADRALDAAMAHVGKNGVTSVHHMGTFADLEVFERAHAAGRLTTRIHAAVPLAEWEALRDRVAARGRGDAWLAIGGLKGFVDGSLGSHTAAMLEPYDDAPADRGLLVNRAEDLYRWTSGADRAGLQVMVHAIGDRAIREQLDIYERVTRENGARDRRFRVEHAQHLSAADVARFGALGVIPSMQPYHCVDDGRWAEELIGRRRAQHTYAFRALLDSGARLAFGSDWFVAPPTPLEGIHAAVTRATVDGKRPGGWVPEQRIGVEEALAAYTSGAAYARFEEGERGTVAAGRLADLVVIDRDLTGVAPEAIREAAVVMTVVGGRVVYEAG
jgi:predicted amidohydrolase YtcJ